MNEELTTSQKCSENLTNASRGNNGRQRET